jgi:hypothetical protein
MKVSDKLRIRVTVTASQSVIEVSNAEQSIDPRPLKCDQRVQQAHTVWSTGHGNDSTVRFDLMASKPVFNLSHKRRKAGHTCGPAGNSKANLVNYIRREI